ncbi:MAG: TlpA disulfide reductase family protein [Bryobacteraceae bacterium]|jgi:thiol-disulfide isomerase/thioredoxin
MRKLTIFLLCAAAALAQAPRRAPGFALFDSKMQVYDLYDYRGKTVILELMQTTCPHCAAFADVLDQVEKKYGGKVQILAVVHAPDDNSNTVAQFVAGHGVHYPILFDQGQMAYSYIRSMTMQFPHVYLIDANGMIQGDYLYGLTTRDIFEGKALFTEIDRLLAGKK